MACRHSMKCIVAPFMLSEVHFYLIRGTQVLLSQHSCSLLHSDMRQPGNFPCRQLAPAGVLERPSRVPCWGELEPAAQVKPQLWRCFVLLPVAPVPQAPVSRPACVKQTCQKLRDGLLSPLPRDLPSASSPGVCSALSLPPAAVRPGRGSPQAEASPGPAPHQEPKSDTSPSLVLLQGLQLASGVT